MIPQVLPLAAMPPSNMISTGARLAEFIAALGRGGWVALDTEFMRERTYAPQLCLVQLDDGENAACIDAPALRDLSPLAELLADESRVKIVHSCRQDLEALDTRGRLPKDFRNLYDTQLAAAFCGYGAQVSYAALVEELCNVHLPKSHTRADWSRRPLPPAQIQYALDDVKYLQPLRGALDRLLEKNGRADWLREECARAADPASYRFDPAGAWRRVKGAGRLDPAGRACVKELALWRERRARARDLPRNWVLPDAALLQLCRDRPRAEKQLARIEGIAAGLRKHAGREIVEIVARAEAAAKHDDGGKDEERAGPLTAQQRRLAKEILKWLEERAKDAGMSRTLVAARRDIEDFVRGQTDLPLFGGWRAQFAGEEIRARYS
ncbi:MAG: ribonuclease D [Gammaproteobacteria bacterium]|nr:ribonuclease D [Gammaproteobacteria bacterium]